MSRLSGRLHELIMRSQSILSTIIVCIPSSHSADGRTYAREEIPLRSERYHCVSQVVKANGGRLTGSEGIMALQSPEMRALYDLKVFVVS